LTRHGPSGYSLLHRFAISTISENTRRRQGRGRGPGSAFRILRPVKRENAAPMDTLGVGIVGLHHLHPVDYLPHFEALSETRVRAIAEPDVALREKVCAAAGVPGYAGDEELLERDDVDLVVAFLPHADCPAFVERAARAGKHVIVEKPMAATAEGIRRMISAAAGAGVQLSAPYCWRYHPVSRQIKEMVDDGVLGDVIALEGRCAAGSPNCATCTICTW